MPKLEYLMTYSADLAAPVEIGAVPSGTRRIYDVTGGRFEGPRLEGKILAGGGDWLLIGNDGIARLDVRGTFETHDGARVYVQYHGVLVINELTTRALVEGRETQYGDTTFMTQPRFETGDPRYAWLNFTVAVAEGRVIPNGVEYRVFEVVNG